MKTILGILVVALAGLSIWLFSEVRQATHTHVAEQIRCESAQLNNARQLEADLVAGYTESSLESLREDVRFHSTQLEWFIQELDSSSWRLRDADGLVNQATRGLNRQKLEWAPKESTRDSE